MSEPSLHLVFVVVDITLVVLMCRRSKADSATCTAGHIVRGSKDLLDIYIGTQRGHPRQIGAND